MKRVACQILLFAVWFVGLITATVIYEAALTSIRSNVVVLYDEEQDRPADWKPPEKWEEMIADKYEAPLAAVYAPWLLVMAGAVLASAQRPGKEKISGWIFGVTLLLSLLFNTVVCWVLYIYLFDNPPLSNSLPSKSPLVALLIAIIGAFVTYNFPELKSVEGQPDPQSGGPDETDDKGSSIPAASK